MSDIKDIISQNTPRYLQELTEFLSIPSVSTDEKYKKDVRRAADWLQSSFSTLGSSEVEIHETLGHPVVTARFGQDPNKPTVLVYGHYDVQPEGSYEEWTTPPYEPTIRDGNIYARGAVDDKGQVFAHLKALEILNQKGELPCNFIYMIEGEEEVGSKNLKEFMLSHKEMLKCDTAVISDSTVIANDVPSMTVGLRGACFLRVKVTGPNCEIHSGTYGGAVANPIEAMSQMIAGMVDKDGRITIPGFYDNVKVYAAEERDAIAEHPHNDNTYKDFLGINDIIGETGYTTIEKTGIRPSFTVHAFHAGPKIADKKGVIPPTAEATMSLRLVPNQESDGMQQRFADHLLSLAPKGVVVTYQTEPVSAPWARPSLNDPIYQVAAQAFEKVWGKAPIPTFNGGSIPVVPMLEEINACPVLMGFGLDEDGYHSPDEHFGIDRLQKGIETLVEFFENLPEVYKSGRIQLVNAPTKNVN